MATSVIARQSETLQNQTPRSSRFVFLDALRGIACLAVLLHHLYHGHPLQPILEANFPAFLHGFTAYGAYGVQIFFVLSGFVIAHSLRATPMTGATVGRFILRRQMRLDPPYWCMMLLCLGLLWLETRIPGQQGSTLPDLKTILINAVYLQGILGVQPIVGVAWTLCIEVQFYLAFIFLLVMAALANRFVKRDSSAPQAERSQASPASQSLLISPWSVALVWLSGVASLVFVARTSMPFLFLQYWFFFAGGVLAYWGLMSRAARPAFLSFGALFAIAIVVFALGGKERPDALVPALVIGWLTLAAIWFVGTSGKLEQWALSPVLQYFGHISYSLYLVHLPVAWLVLRVGAKVTGASAPATVLWLLLAMALSIGLAHLFFLWIERPSMAFAGRFKKASAPTPLPTLGGVQSQ